MGDWGAKSVFQAALADIKEHLWETIIYNGVSIKAKVFRFPQDNLQDGIYNFRYQIETDEISEPVDNATVIITEAFGPVTCFSGQVSERTTDLTWTIDCPRKG